MKWGIQTFLGLSVNNISHCSLQRYIPYALAKITSYNNGGQSSARRNVLCGSAGWIAVQDLTFIASFCFIFNFYFMYHCVYTSS